MKKTGASFISLILILIGLNLPQTAVTQTIELSLGTGFTYTQFPDFDNPGFNFRAYAQFNDKVSAMLGFNYYFIEKYKTRTFEDNTSFYEFNANVHYIIPIIDYLDAYALGGFNIAAYKKYTTEWIGNPITITKTGYGGNFGAGASWYFNDNFKAYGELKYTLTSNDLTHFGLVVGILIKLTSFDFSDN